MKQLSVVHCLPAALLLLVLVGTAPTARGQPIPRTSESDERVARYFERFPEADANGDGVLSLAEGQAHIARRKAREREREGPEPTHADVRYGPHERNVYDLWLPEREGGAETTLPLLVFFHGGGFVAGDKSSLNANPYLEAGFAVASANYRLVDGETTLSPAPLFDSARVIQHLRHRAAEWNLDPGRIVVSGGSAGAVITMWIGYHDDLADPEAEDPVARESTRVSCLAPINGPTQLDPAWIHENLGGPPEVHRSFPKLFGAGVEGFASDPEVQARVREASPMEHVSPDDPPTLLLYKGGLEGIPLPESASQGTLIHHAWFGKLLKEKLDEAGVPNEFHPTLEAHPARTITEWAEKQW